MMLEKLKFVAPFLVFLLFSINSLSQSSEDKYVAKIKEQEALVDYEKKNIKNLLLELKERKAQGKSTVKLNKLIKVKYKDLNQKVEELNELIKAVSHSSEKINRNQIKSVQSVEELQDEVGIDRKITSVQENVKKIYKDFRSKPESKKWDKKKDHFFKEKKHDNKIILVE